MMLVSEILTVEVYPAMQNMVSVFSELFRSGLNVFQCILPV